MSKIQYTITKYTVSAKYKNYEISNVCLKEIRTKKAEKEAIKKLKEGIESVEYSIFRNASKIAGAKKLGFNIKISQEYNGYGYSITDRYIVGLGNICELIDYLVKKDEKEEAKKTRILDKVSKDFDKILLAIYTVSKEAKKQRDIKYSIADSVYSDDAYRHDSLAHHQIQNAKDNIEYYYNKKEKGIRYMVRSRRYSRLEVHDVNGSDMAYIENGKFGFHFPLHVLEDMQIKAIHSKIQINEWSKSEKVIKGMSLNTALTILNNLEAINSLTN